VTEAAPQTTSTGRKPSDTIRSVQRAARLLQEIGNASRPPSAAELARSTALNVSTCHHLLNTLEEEALVVRGADGRYALGPQLLFLADRLTATMPVFAELVTILEELNARTRETAYLVAWHGDHISVLAARLGLEPIVVGDLRLGYREHAHAKASGKAILAFAPSAAVDRYLHRHPLVALTPRTVASRRALERQFARIRAEGFAEEVEEYATGVACLAAPVLTAGGLVIGALALSVPVDRFAAQHAQLVEAVVGAGRRAGELLGRR
jgi:IclR family acetate operon transcriptional repressor